MTDLAKLHAAAQRIPSGDVDSDLHCLCELYYHSPKYYDFCYARFVRLSGDPRTIRRVRALAESEPDPERFVPLLELFLGCSSAEDSAGFLFALLFASQGPHAAAALLIHPSLPRLSAPLLGRLFDAIPGRGHEHIVQARDSLLFRHLLAGADAFALGCLARVPASHGALFLQEFLLLAAHLLAAGFARVRVAGLIVNAACAGDDAAPLLQVLAAGGCRVPRALADSAGCACADLGAGAADAPLAELPPLLRPRVLEPAPARLDGPRFCRFVRSRDALRRELAGRIRAERDPRMLHDYLLAYGGFVSLPRELPFRFTLLAAAAIRDARLVALYLSEFGRVGPADGAGVVLAAAAGLEALALRNADAVLLVFPQIRRLYAASGRAVQVRLLNAMGTAVGNGLLDAEIAWLTYRSIRTLPESCAHFDGVLHFALIGLADADDRAVAISWLEVLWRRDRTGVIGGLWRIPAALRPPGDFLPPTAPAYSLREDQLVAAVAEAMSGELTTVRLLLLATAFVAHSELFGQERREWVRLLVAAGDAVFALALDDRLLASATEALASGDALMRFAGAFALAVFLAHRLTPGAGPAVERLITAARGDASSAVRLMALYGLSHCTVPQPLHFVLQIADRARSAGESSEDLMGVGYCIGAWFTWTLQLFKEEGIRRKYGRQRFLWPFMHSVCRMLGIADSALWKDEDRLGLAQLIALEHSNPVYDRVVTDFLNAGELSEWEAMTAILGFVPCIAFRVAPFDPDGRQERILRAARGPEHGLLRLLVGHQRRSHANAAAAAVGAPAATTMERLRNDAAALEPAVLTALLTALSDAQRTELYADLASEAVLAVAIHERSAGRVAERLAFKRRSAETLAKVRDAFDGQLAALVEAMLSLGAVNARVAELLVFVRFGELLTDEANAQMIPALLAEIPPTDGIVSAVIRRRDAWLAEYAHCALLRHPGYFETHESGFDLFH
jgi:hypothetical protein